MLEIGYGESKRARRWKWRTQPRRACSHYASALLYNAFSMACREMIELGHKYGIQVYPRMETYTSDGLLWRYLEAWRAVAMNLWDAGADGIYLFNAYDRMIEKSPVTYVTDNRPLLEIGDPEKIATLDKLYAVDIDRATIGYGAGDVIFYMPRNNILPLSLLDKQAHVQFLWLMT